MKILTYGLMPILLSLMCLFGSREASILKPQESQSASFSVPILLYHSVSEDGNDALKIAPSRFKEQLSYLKSHGFHPIHLKDLLAYWNGGRPLPSKPVIITLDDGYEDNYTAAYPILLQTHTRATIFAVTGSIGTTDRLTWKQLREMEASGLVDTQSHTVTHPDLTKLSEKDKLTELGNSKDEILKHLGHQAIALAYPYGFYDQHTLQAAQKAGYLLALTVEGGFAKPEQGRFALHRILITGDMTLDQFKSVVTPR
ncbi:polysaccharide deacetylase family protein [Paenibacillus sp. J22TS3]|uniref:polysaccharide deacetylase family protein n=1 Tax=Paenibacillus sp. J22TS3 TaxID=2807192 RepID=UPI001BCC65BF|nr:polysaccharide deacetylase family protein [Paenibacillus sp. J22TS3]